MPPRACSVACALPAAAGSHGGQRTRAEEGLHYLRHLLPEVPERRKIRPCRRFLAVQSPRRGALRRAWFDGSVQVRNVSGDADQHERDMGKRIEQVIPAQPASVEHRDSERAMGDVRDPEGHRAERGVRMTCSRRTSILRSSTFATSFEAGRRMLRCEFRYATSGHTHFLRAHVLRQRSGRASTPHRGVERRAGVLTPWCAHKYCYVN